MKYKKYYLALDLKNDPESISKYEKYHEKVWPEVLNSIQDSGIRTMEIYRVENRLFMIIEAENSFTFENKEKLDMENERVQAWEELMWKYQQAIPNSKPGEKWRNMKKIFDLSSNN
jgi:L-rhamnose mutarotase